MGDMLREVSRAVRTLAKRPTFSLIAILVIAVGIGANTAIFSVVNGVLLLPGSAAESRASLWCPTSTTPSQTSEFRSRSRIFGIGGTGTVPSASSPPTWVGAAR